MRVTRAATVRMGRQKHAIIDEIVTEAEKLGLEPNDYAIYQVDDLSLKAVVQFHSRIIHVMTNEEARAAQLPGC
jgi:hypothetical protein